MLNYQRVWVQIERLCEPLLDGSLMIHIHTHPIFCDIKRLFSSTIKQDPWSFVPSDNQTWQWVVTKCRWCLLLFPPFGDFPLPFGHRRVRGVVVLRVAATTRTSFRMPPAVLKARSWDESTRELVLRVRPFRQGALKILDISWQGVMSYG